MCKIREIKHEVKEIKEKKEGWKKIKPKKELTVEELNALVYEVFNSMGES